MGSDGSSFFVLFVNLWKEYCNIKSKSWIALKTIYQTQTLYNGILFKYNGIIYKGMKYWLMLQCEWSLKKHAKWKGVKGYYDWHI